MNGDMFDDTEPQPVLRFEVDPAPVAPVDPSADVLPPPRVRRGRHAWLVAGATAAVVALGATGYLISRQAPAAARGPGPAVSASSAPDGVGAAASPTSAVAPDAPLSAGQDTLVLGDSLALAVYPYLADLVPDRFVSYVGEVGSSTEWALAQVEQMQAQGERVPRVVIVSAGTNDWYAQDFRHAASELLDRLGPKRCVVWSNIARPAVVNGASVDPSEDLNAVLADLALTHPNLRVLDWAGAAADNSSWLAGDGIHPNEEGTIERAHLFADASYACSPRDPDAPVADKQYLPLSSFYIGGTPGTGTQPTYAPSVAPTPHPSRTSEPTPTKTRSPKPTKTAKPTPTQTESEPPPTQTEDPPTASDPPGDDGGGAGGGG